MAATPFTFSGSLSFPPSSGQPVASRPFSQSGTFTRKHDDTYELTGAGTKVVTFDEAVKAVMLVAEAATAVLNVRINGGTDDIEVSAGGFIAISNPVPGVGITSISIVYTAAATVHVLGLS